MLANFWFGDLDNFDVMFQINKEETIQGFNYYKSLVNGLH